VEAQPTELSVGNTVRRVLHLIKEDYTSWIMEDPDVPAEFKRQQSSASMSMYNLLGDSSTTTVDYGLPASNNLKSAFIQAINELIDEIESIYQNIANQAIEHIHSNEIIMTIGKSKTVEEFLRAAHRKRKFQVIVAEAAPLYGGHEFVINLAKAGIEATLITDSAIFAVMSRVNKVILGTHAVLANGGLIASSGSQVFVYSEHYLIYFVFNHHFNS
jgi:translation initiation factor eIF-2B subunit beta